MSKLAGRRKPAVAGGRPWSREVHSLIVYFSCAAMLVASGCATMHTVDPQAESEIEPGERVVVSLQDGREVELSFESWTSAGLTGTDETGILQKIEPEDIARVEVERYSPLRSIGLGIVVIGVVAAAAYDSSGLY
ncbi:MAG: hypothetical protein ACREQ8_18140 [Woeseiaceae bacterium]